jgi:hypothetical protein
LPRKQAKVTTSCTCAHPSRQRLPRREIAPDHGGAVQTRYAHMSRLNVGWGQRVNAGDIIGFVGSTGNSTGPHVHYEIRQNGRALIPLSS